MSNNKVEQPKKSIYKVDFQRKAVFVVVDGISTGRHLAPLLRGNGYDVVHVWSKKTQGLGVPPNEHDYILNLAEGDSLDPILEALAPYTVRAVIPGAEGGVVLADQLSEALKIPGRNDISKLQARTQKFHMQETIRQHGLLAAKQIQTDNLGTLLSWVEDNGYPVVLKPDESAGTDGVHFCYTEKDVTHAFQAIMSSVNIYKLQNCTVVAQEMLKGEEFMVNTVSLGGAISITDIIFVQKTVLNDSPLYNYSTIISPDDPRFQRIADYVKQVLPVLGLHSGAAHTEVIITDKGPTLVEVNPRLTGAFDMSATNDAVGHNHVGVLIRAYTKENYLQKRSLQDKPHQANTLTSFFIAETGGTLKKDPDFSAFQAIPGFHSLKFGHKEGSELAKTISLMNSPGMVNFVSDRKETLLIAHSLFRKAEKSFFKDLMDTPESSQTPENKMS